MSSDRRERIQELTKKYLLTLKDCISHNTPPQNIPDAGPEGLTASGELGSQINLHDYYEHQVS